MKNFWKWAALGLAVFLVVFLAGGVVAALTSDPKPTATATASPASSRATSPVAATTLAPSKAAPQTFGSGTYVVGKEIAPGRYVATMTEGQYCYWERLKSDSGDLDDVIANEVYADPGKRSFTVKATDKYVQFKGDCTWARA